MEHHMKPSNQARPVADCPEDGLQSALERKFIQDYLQSKGYDRATISALPEEKAKTLMREACLYASLKLAEIESRAHLRASIHLPD